MSDGRDPGPAPWIWIDLDNAPHVPFFRPLIRGLEDRGHGVWVTARDDGVVPRLADALDVKCDVIGRGRAGTRTGKALKVMARAARLARGARRRPPGKRTVLAVGHGSRPQALAARALGIPALCILDYEHVATGLLRRCSQALLVPDRLSDEVLGAAGLGGMTTHRYPGLKEEVYLWDRLPQAEHRERTGIAAEDILVLLRPESDTAHYLERSTEATLEGALLDRLAADERVWVWLVPRRPVQAERLGRELGRRGIRWSVPEPADGRDLIGAADLVVSGGGTMAREAAALGVPSYSIFRGLPGAVDQALAREGRLGLIRSRRDTAAIPLAQRDRNRDAVVSRETYDVVLDTIIRMAGEASGHTSQDP